MEGVMSTAGIAKEDRPTMIAVANTLIAATDVEECSFVAVAESPTVLMKAYGLGTSMSVRSVFGAIAKCRGVKDAIVQFPRVGYAAPLDMHVHVLKPHKRGLARYEPLKVESTFFKSRFAEATTGQVTLSKHAIKVVDAIVAEVVTYASESLKIDMSLFSPDRCEVRFLGMRECSLSFVEHLFGRYERRIEDATLASKGIERFMLIRVNADGEFPAFPARSNEEEVERVKKKKARLFGGAR